MDLDAWRTLWTLVVVCVIAYAIFLFWGSVITAADNERDKTIVAQHWIENGRHVLSGMVMVPSPCYGLYVEARSIGSNTYRLSFHTPQETQGCSAEPHPRAFRTVIPISEVSPVFTASLNGSPVSLRVNSSRLQ